MQALESIVTESWRRKVRAYEKDIADAIEKELARIEIGRHDKLTPREVQVFRMFVGGMGQTEIAKRLCRSTKTVGTHRDRILRKLGLDHTQQLVFYAVKMAAESGK